MEAKVAAALAENKKHRTTLKKALARLFTTCHNPDATIEDKRVRAEKADDIFKQFEDIQSRIEAVIPENQLHVKDKYREEFKNKYFAIKALAAQAESEVGTASGAGQSYVENVVQALVYHQTTMSALIESMASNQIAHSQSPSVASIQQKSQPPPQQPSRHELRLPVIQIPEFDGKTLEWIRIRDLFESMIHTRSSISEAEKLAYLHTKLKGDALSLVKHLKPTNDNYVIAWNLLKNKFDSSEKVKHAYLSLLLEQQPIKVGSAVEILKFYNGVNEAYNALKVFNEPVQHWDSILLFKLEKRLDTETTSLWYRGKKHDVPTTFQQFLQFLDKRVYKLDREIGIDQIEPQSTVQKNVKFGKNQSRTYTAVVRVCPACNNHHEIYRCDRFKAISIKDKQGILKNNKLCFNCLQPNHTFKTCESKSCKTCGGRHNILLHVSSHGQPKVQQNVKGATPSEYQQDHLKNQQVVNISMSMKQRTYVLLPTAIIMIIDRDGVTQQCRALLDSSSQTTLITEACAQRLNLQRIHDTSVLYGINSNIGSQTRGKVQLTINAKFGDKIISTQTLCLSNLTQLLPAQEIDNDNLTFFKNLQMADELYNKPAKIDVILGADVFMDCCLPRKIKHPSGSPTAMKTIFGWVLLGNITALTESTLTSYHISNSLEQQLERFWDLEEISPTSKHLTPEEEEAETHYVTNTTHNEYGRYVVKLPIKNNKINVGKLKSITLKRLYAMERKFKMQPELYTGYNQFMSQYIGLGHMEISSRHHEGETCFLPHHAVFKSSSTTTKFENIKLAL